MVAMRVWPSMNSRLGREANKGSAGVMEGRTWSCRKAKTYHKHFYLASEDL